MKRIAYIGLSTPLFYDYRQPASKAPSDMSSSPNPILDSPFGLLLLYDELWFLCRSLCPENMRDLSYVKFLDEDNRLPPLEDIGIQIPWQDIKSNPTLHERYNKLYESFSVYQDTVKRVGIHWDAAADNHTHGLKIGNIKTSGNSVSLEKILFDMEVIKRIGHQDVEFITNSFTQRFLEDPNSPIMKAKLVELLIIENIPNYLSHKGPYHPCVEEARNDTFLKDFRKEINSKVKTADEKEILEIKREVEAAIQKSQDEIFLKNLDPKTQYKSIGRTLAGAGIDLIIPGVSTVESIIEEVTSFFDNGKRRWQGFIVSSRYWQTKSSSNSG